jgi:hypothetical protein
MIDVSLQTAFQLLTDTAFAQSAGVPPPLPNCSNFTNLFGCGGATNVIATNVVPNLAVFFLRFVAACSVLFIVWSGIQMMIAGGDTGKRDTARMSIMYALLGLGVALSAQLLVGFVATENFGQGNAENFVIGGAIKSAVRILITLVNAILGFVIILQGFRMVMAQGKSDVFNEARSALLSAVLGAIVVNAALVLVRTVATFFGS